MVNKNVFEIVKPFDNDKFSLMGTRDLYEFKASLKNYYLSLRESLDLSKNITFGLEVETENIKEGFYKLEKDSKYSSWNFSSDDTLICGREVVSPILKDNYNTWNIIDKFINSLGNCSEILSTCGGHIHIGAQILGSDLKYYGNLFKLWCAYENIIFRFGYGEYISERSKICRYASDLLTLGSKINFDIDDISFHGTSCKALNYAKTNRRKELVNREYIKGCTFEVRSPNGSLNPIIWQNNINFFVKLFEYAKSDKFDENLILKRIKQLNDSLIIYDDVLDYYRLIEMDTALELADLIFDNNIDKVYFLRQYIKNEEVGTKPLEKGKKFTKCKNY